MTTQAKRKQKLGGKVVGRDKDYGTTDAGQPINPHFSARSAAHSGEAFIDAVSPEAERVLKQFYPNSPKSRGRR
jgi:hypothetical protein